MDIPPLLVQFAGSLIAILALYALARAMRLGGERVLENDESVKSVATEVEDGFEARRVAIARGGLAALASDDEGRIMLIKRHGNQFAGRILSGDARVSEEVDAIIVTCGDPRFGPVRLSLDNPATWVDAINRL